MLIINYTQSHIPIYDYSEMTPEGRRITKLDEILLNGKVKLHCMQLNCNNILYTSIVLVLRGQTPPLFDIWMVGRPPHCPNIKKGRSLAV